MNNTYIYIISQVNHVEKVLEANLEQQYRIRQKERIVE